MSTSLHLSVHIDRPVADVYAFAAEPANLPRWAAGLGSSFVQEDGRWFTTTPGGRAEITFAPPNDLGVLDQHVLTPEGATVYVPLRVTVDGAGSEVVFTLRRETWMDDEAFERDAALVTADLETLRAILEGE
jgi:Polyketide cyclase / dehydrase and lipid transport